MPSHIYDAPQSYFIYGGLAFVALTEPYLHEWGDEWMSDAPHELVNLVMSGIATQPDEQPVSRRDAPPAATPLLSSRTSIAARPSRPSAPPCATCRLQPRGHQPRGGRITCRATTCRALSR